MTDTERLDWLERHPGTAHGKVSYGSPEAGQMGLWYEDYSRSPPSPAWVAADTFREAIDEAAALERRNVGGYEEVPTLRNDDTSPAQVNVTK